jgi:hypothetical protein
VRAREREEFLLIKTKQSHHFWDKFGRAGGWWARYLLARPRLSLILNPFTIRIYTLSPGNDNREKCRAAACFTFGAAAENKRACTKEQEKRATEASPQTVQKICKKNSTFDSIPHT